MEADARAALVWLS